MLNRAGRIALVASLLVPAAAFTFGGWSVTTVIDVPEYAVAGTPVEFVYEVRQHGMGLMSDLNGSVEATLHEASVSAKSTSFGNLVRGRYRSTLTFPHAGEWNVKIGGGWGPIGGDMLPLTVIARGAAAPPPMSPANRGRHLFVAKGCVSCHTHQLTKGFNSVKNGPDLSEPKFMADYLTRFLADPSIKTTWASPNRMPDLGLKPAEITALVAFLNKEGKISSR
jgi:mono/diheme cytochrome c family protein